MSAIERTVVALRELATSRDGVFGVDAAAAWFDGFSDFVVTERDALVNGRSWWVSAPGWLAMLWERARAHDEPELRLDVFVERKDYRPGRVAPWPVSSIYLDNGQTVPPDQLPPRARDEAQAARLERFGCTVEVGYWGAHVYRRVAAAPSPTELAAIVDAALSVIPAGG